MKKLITFFSFFVLGFFITSEIYAQAAASATWALTSNTSVATVGNITAGAQSHTDMVVNSYTGSNGPLGVQSQRNTTTSGAWPGEAAYVSSRYIEFTIAPQANYTLTVSDITVPIGAQGGGNMRADIYYSLDNFATSTQLNPALLVLPSGAYVNPAPSYSSLGITVLSGQTLSIRVFPFYTSASSGKYVLLQNVQVAGTTVFTPPVFYDLTTSVVGNGAVAGGGNYLSGTTVPVLATSDPGWEFSNWTGDAAGTDSSINVLMIGNKSITAVFKKYAPVTVQFDGFFDGTTISPAAAPNGKYALGTSITITPQLHPTYHVTKMYVNDVEVNVAVPYTFTITEPTTVKFVVKPDLKQFILTTVVGAHGSIEVSPEPYHGTYDQNTFVALKAVPDEGYIFNGWSGAVTSQSEEQAIIMSEDKLVIAAFGKAAVLTQPGSATWSLTTDQTASVTGNFTSAADEGIGPDLDGTRYGSSYTGFGDNWHRIATTTDKQLPASYSAGSYVEYSITTSADALMNIVNFNAIGGGTSNAKIAVYYSLDGFATSKELGEATLGTSPTSTSPANIDSPISLQNSGSTSTGAENISFAPMVEVKAGKTFAIRIYAWCSSAAKYLAIKNVYIADNGLGAGGSSASLPTLGSIDVVFIRATNAAVKSMVVTDGNADISAKGICWSTKKNPTINDFKTDEGRGLNSFSSYLTELTAGTKYYLKAYATNSAGTGYSKQDSITTASYVQLNASVVGSGQIITDPVAQNMLFEENEIVALTAVPNQGWEFLGWAGDAQGTENPISVTIGKVKNIVANFQSVTGIEDAGIPTQFALYQNYPNPFNPTTKISFSLPEGANVKLKIYDMLAREVDEIINEFKPAGRYEVTFDAGKLSSGTYFYKLEAGHFIQVRKLILVK